MMSSLVCIKKIQPLQKLPKCNVIILCVTLCLNLIYTNKNQ